MLLVLLRPGRTEPLTLLALLLIGVGGVGLLRRAGQGEAGAAGCDPAVDAVCPDEPAALPATATPAPVLSAAEACLNVGYLCSPLGEADRLMIQRWRGVEGPLVVHVPLPDLQDEGAARGLQRAAVAGIRLWNGQPFPIAVDERGTREAHVRVRWSLAMGGARLGITRTEWSASSGLRVRDMELAALMPRTARPIDPAQVRLAAAHEMGHALGLPHSDQSRDVMYPSNTATALSARDYRTLEALYALEDGTEIVR